MHLPFQLNGQHHLWQRLHKSVSVDTELEPEVNPSLDMFEDGGDDNEEMPELQECSDNKDEDEWVHKEYEKNKAMADADHDVSRDLSISSICKNHTLLCVILGM